MTQTRFNTPVGLTAARGSTSSCMGTINRVRSFSLGTRSIRAGELPVRLKARVEASSRDEPHRQLRLATHFIEAVSPSVR